MYCEVRIVPQDRLMPVPLVQAGRNGLRPHMHVGKKLYLITV